MSTVAAEQNGPIQMPLYTPSVDAVQEFRVQQSNFSAEIGFSGSTVLNVVTRSGTNAIHGSLYQFARNEKFNANNFFNNAAGIAIPPMRWNQFGATVGGADGGEAYYYLADILATTAPDDLKAAAATVKKALERSPNDAYAHALAGRIEAKMGDKLAAIAAYERAATLMPDLPEPHTQLAKRYAERGDSEKAARETAAMSKVAAQQGDGAARPAFLQSLVRVEARETDRGQ